MKKRKISVLITGVGGAGTLGRELMKSLKLSLNNYKIIVTNSSSLSVGLYDDDKSYLISKATTKSYINDILNICKKEKIDVIIGGSEPEIKKLAENHDLFLKNKIVLLSNKEKIINLCSDKLKLSEFLIKNKIKTPKTFAFHTKKDIKKIESYPVIIKPKTGYPLEIKDGMIASVSIIAPLCADADALATTLMLLSKEEGLKLIESVKDAEAYIIYLEGDNLYTEQSPGFKKYIYK